MLAPASCCSPSLVGDHAADLGAARGRPLSPLVPGRLRPLRLLWIGCVYLVWDAAALLALFVLWVASGFGWRIRSPAFQRAHYVLAGWFLRVLFWQARWALRLSIDVVGTDPDTALPGRPELVLCRHAGPGDSFILIHALVNWFDREPRIVLKDTLAVGPGDRRAAQPAAQPVHRADPGRGEDSVSQIGHLATGLDDERRVRDLPGGRQLHPGRRLRAIARLRAPRPGADGAARRADAARARPAARRDARRAGRRPGRRGDLRGAHRAGPDAHRRATCGGSCRWTSGS